MWFIFFNFREIEQVKSMFCIEMGVIKNKGLLLKNELSPIEKFETSDKMGYNHL